jgi:type I restriction enzyme S subunit
MRKYSKYKTNEVEWLGDTPIDWSLEKVKFHLSFSKGTNPKELIDENTDELPEYISVENLRGKQKNIQYVKDWKTCKLIDDNDLLLLWDGANAGEFMKGKKGVLSSTMAKLLFHKKITKEFGWYLFIRYEKEIREVTIGMGIPHVNGQDLKNSIVPIPSLPEQHAIVRFLDYKTGQIDSFIANRQKQIELLKEQLHFKINQAITKGIDTKANFKSTDIKYVPEIPEHWDIRKFKSLTSILTCGVAATPEYVDESEGILFLSAQNVKPFRMLFEKLAYIKPELHKQLTRYKKPLKGDVLVTRVGGDSNIGDACIVDTDIEFSVYVSLTHIRPNKEILSEYIVYFFNTEYCYQLNHEGTVAGGGQGNLNVKNVERYRIPLPPIEEQKQIIAYLDNYRLEMDKLISKYQKQIELMQEYRTSLISQAVTGKIDVREWQPKKQQAV